MPLIDLVATGGTIASRSGVAGRQATVRADELLSTLGSVPRGVEVRARDVATKGSYAFGTADLLGLVREVRSALAGDADGIVLTHGTDAMEETAILLDLVNGSAKPVVLTGAQRAADIVDTDGPRNLRDAITVAADPAARGHGAMVVFGGSVFAARGVRKSHTVDLAAFSNPAGTIGYLYTGSTRLQARPVRPTPLTLPDARFDAVRVDTVAAYPGGDDLLLRAAVAAGARGIVLAAMGIGNASPGVADAIADITRAGVVVALSTRVAAGPILPVYGDGGGADLVAAGAVPVALPASQARIALALLLSSDRSAADVAAELDLYA